MSEEREARRLFRMLAVVVGLIVWPLAHQIVDVSAIPFSPAREGALRIAREVRAAQSTYRSVHGYYDRLECLVQDACVPNPYPPTYLKSEAARPVAYGYRFHLADGPRARVATGEFVSPTGMNGYALTAVPIASASGAASRPPSFCADADGIYEYADGRAPVVDGGRCLHRIAPVQ